MPRTTHRSKSGKKVYAKRAKQVNSPTFNPTSGRIGRTLNAGARKEK